MNRRRVHDCVDAGSAKSLNGFLLVQGNTSCLDAFAEGDELFLIDMLAEACRSDEMIKNVVRGAFLQLESDGEEENAEGEKAEETPQEGGAE